VGGADASSSKSQLDKLYANLKEDQVSYAQSVSSQGQQSTQTPTREEKKMQQETNPLQGLQNHAFSNALGDYSQLCSQFSGKGFKSSAENAMVVATLDSRRNMERIEDTSTDGYSLLTNSFGLITQSEKNQKKSAKLPKLASTVLH
jgi:hypothetical protein